LKSYTEAAAWIGASSLHRNQFRDEKTDLFGLKIGWELTKVFLLYVSSIESFAGAQTKQLETKRQWVQNIQRHNIRGKNIVYCKFAVKYEISSCAPGQPDDLA
jgi:outer membrane receptor for Fe3+-dicitrate